MVITDSIQRVITLIICRFIFIIFFFVFIIDIGVLMLRGVAGIVAYGWFLDLLPLFILFICFYFIFFLYFIFAVYFPNMTKNIVFAHILAKRIKNPSRNRGTHFIYMILLVVDLMVVVVIIHICTISGPWQPATS